MTVPADDFSLDPAAGWRGFFLQLMVQGKGTWNCTGWAPWLRYALTIVVIVISVLALAAGLAYVAAAFLV
jgi:hypothetical protein